MTRYIPEVAIAFAQSLSNRYHQLTQDYERFLVSIGVYMFDESTRKNKLLCVKKGNETVHITGFSTNSEKEICIHAVDMHDNHIILSPEDYNHIEVYQRIIVQILNDDYNQKQNGHV